MVSSRQVKTENLGRKKVGIGYFTNRSPDNGQYLEVSSSDPRPFFSYQAVESGVSAKYIREIEGKELTRDDIRMIIPDRTLDRRIAEGSPLKLEEADGIARLLRVVAMARKVFTDNALADEWLRTANPALDNHIPIRMARSDLGGREVEAVLGRIEHGVFG